ncbi:MAG: NAD(P)H-dependent oxidoreductase [Sediminicola sp.]|tara:strand:- start:13829 stop:14362 length:534 start_codon:yes stop_codon:yes gene_type:complete
MAKVLAFAGSNSSKSLNFKLVTYTGGLISGHSVELLDMSEWPFPMYGTDHEREHGITDSLTTLMRHIQNADALILSVNEHNGAPSAYFKNVLDWLSRMDRKFLDGKSVLLMSTAPGRMGGKFSLAIVEQLLPRFGAVVVGSFVLPFFHENLDMEKGITDSGLKQGHQEALQLFLQAL